MLPTLLAAAGDTTVKEDLKKGQKVGDTTYKVHLDGYNLLPALKGEGAVAAQGVHLLDRRRQRRRAALRQLEDDVPASSDATGLMSGRSRSSSCACRSFSTCACDPFERARPRTAWATGSWRIEHVFLIAPAGAYVGQWLQSFREFPPRQKPGSFNLDHVMEAVTSHQGSGR